MRSCTTRPTTRPTTHFYAFADAHHGHADTVNRHILRNLTRKACTTVGGEVLTCLLKAARSVDA
jgi:hypothetical protein